MGGSTLTPKQTLLLLLMCALVLHPCPCQVFQKTASKGNHSMKGKLQYHQLILSQSLFHQSFGLIPFSFGHFCDIIKIFCHVFKITKTVGQCFSSLIFETFFFITKFFFKLDKRMWPKDHQITIFGIFDENCVDKR